MELVHELSDIIEHGIVRIFSVDNDIITFQITVYGDRHNPSSRKPGHAHAPTQYIIRRKINPSIRYETRQPATKYADIISRAYNQKKIGCLPGGFYPNYKNYPLLSKCWPVHEPS